MSELIEQNRDQVDDSMLEDVDRFVEDFKRNHGFELRIRKPAKVALVKMAAEENRSVFAFARRNLPTSSTDYPLFPSEREKNHLSLKEKLLTIQIRSSPNGWSIVSGKNRRAVSNPNPEAVRATFESVAPRYDLANHFLSGGIDFYWRRQLVKMANQNSPARMMYLIWQRVAVMFCLHCEMVCLLILALRELIFVNLCFRKPEASVRRKDLRKIQTNFIWGDCLSLDFPDNSFDLITISFGLRNLEDRKKGLKEMNRVLKPGGRLIVLEFSQPFFWFRPFYYFYLRLILPWMARLVTGDRDAYLYLGSSISAFPDRFGLVKEFENAGFERISFSSLTFAIVALHLGYKKK